MSSKKFLGNAGIYLGSSVLNAGIPFFLMPVLTRVLSPADYGVIAMFLVAVNVLSAVVGLSVHGVISVRYFQLGKIELAQYVGACVGIMLVSAIVLILIFILFGSYLVRITHIPIEWLLFAVIISGFQFLGNIRLALWQASGAPWSYGKYQVAQSLVNGGLSLLLVLLVGMAWEGRAAGYGFAFAIFGLLAFYSLLREGLIRMPVNLWAVVKDALRFGVPLIPHVLGASLAVTLDRYLIAELLDISRAGIYMVAFQIGQILGLLTESFNKVFAPWLIAKLCDLTPSEKRSIVKRTYLYFILVPLLAFVFGVLAPWLLPFFVGPSFYEAGPLLIYIAMGFAFNGCYFMVTNYIFFAGKTELLAIVTFVSAMINVPLLIILIGQYGIAGAAKAFMLTQLFSFLATWFIAHKVHPMPWFKAVKTR